MRDIEIVDVGDYPIPRDNGSSGQLPAFRGPAVAADARPVPILIAALALVVAAVLAAVALAGWRARAHTITTVRTVPATIPVAVDALGCPVTTSCTVGIVALPRQMAAISHWDVGAQVDSTVAVYNKSGVAVHALVVVEASRPRSIVTITAQCVPGGARVRESVRPATDGTAVSVTVGGRAGCSVVVTGSAGRATLTRLAREPGLQL